MNLEISFEKAPWERTLEALEFGCPIRAVPFLTLMEGEDEDTLEEAFRLLEEGRHTLDLSDLPPQGYSGEAARRLREEAELVQKGSLMTALEESDPLRLYLEELAAIPAAGDVQVLAEALLEGQEVQNTLTNLCLSRVVELACGYAGQGVLLLDLIQEASVGLWESILHYEGGDFTAHRDWWINQSLARAVLTASRAAGLGQKLRRAAEDYRMVDERLLSELGRNATLAEIAEQLHITVEETEAVRKMLDNARRLGKVHVQDAPEELDPEAEQAVEDTAYYQTRERVDSLMSGLTKQELLVVNLRYGLGGKAPKTAAEVGKKLGLTITEVVEIETAALTKMRQSGE